MGNMCSFTGTRPSNRILPTNPPLLALGLGNKDLALYRRHRKKDDHEVDHGLPTKSRYSQRAVTKQPTGGEGGTKESLQDCTSSLEPDGDMQEWLDSITFQNNLLPSFMTFDNKRHLSMRSKYTDARQAIKLRNVIDESQEEHRNNSLPSSGKVKRLKKNAGQKINKILSHETFNLGIGPSPMMSTRISKDAVKRNKRKDDLAGFRGRKTPPPPKPMSGSLNTSIVGVPNGSVSQDADESRIATNSKKFHVSSNWLDEDFYESILSYPKDIPKSLDTPQSPRPAPTTAQRDQGKKSIRLKIEPETSEPAVHDLGLFLSAVDEDKSDPISEGKSGNWFSDVFRKKSRAKTIYATEGLPLCDDDYGADG